MDYGKIDERMEVGLFFMPKNIEQQMKFKKARWRLCA